MFENGKDMTRLVIIKTGLMQFDFAAVERGRRKDQASFVEHARRTGRKGRRRRASREPLTASAAGSEIIAKLRDQLSLSLAKTVTKRRDTSRRDFVRAVESKQLELKAQCARDDNLVAPIPVAKRGDGLRVENRRMRTDQKHYEQEKAHYSERTSRVATGKSSFTDERPVALVEHGVTGPEHSRQRTARGRPVAQHVKHHSVLSDVGVSKFRAPTRTGTASSSVRVVDVSDTTRLPQRHVHRRKGKATSEYKHEDLATEHTVTSTPHFHHGKATAVHTPILSFMEHLRQPVRAFRPRCSCERKHRDKGSQEDPGGHHTEEVVHKSVSRSVPKKTVRRPSAAPATGEEEVRHAETHRPHIEHTVSRARHDMPKPHEQERISTRARLVLEAPPAREVVREDVGAAVAGVEIVSSVKPVKSVRFAEEVVVLDEEHKAVTKATKSVPSSCIRPAVYNTEPEAVSGRATFAQARLTKTKVHVALGDAEPEIRSVSKTVSAPQPRRGAREGEQKSTRVIKNSTRQRVVSEPIRQPRPISGGSVPKEHLSLDKRQHQKTMKQTAAFREYKDQQITK